MSRHEMFDTTPVVTEGPRPELGVVAEEEIILDSSAAVDAFEEFVVADVLERARRHGVSSEEFKNTEVSKKLTEFTSVLASAKQKIETAEELSELEEQQIQMAYDAIDRASLAATEELLVEVPGETHRDVGVPLVSVGVDLSVDTEGVKLEPSSLDDADESVTINVKATSPDKPTFESFYTEEELTSELYGMKVPDENAPVYAIASFREGLKVAVRHVKDLREMPDKQQLFAELLSMLDYVPSDGLNESDARKLKDLVRKINTPNGMPTEDPSASKDVLSPELQLQADLAEFGQVRLEPDKTDEASVSVSAAEASPVQFIPDAVLRTSERDMSLAQQEKMFQKKVKQAVDKIEGIGSGNAFIKFFNESPYESLSEVSFDEVIEQASGSKKRALMGDAVFEKAMNNWVSHASEIRKKIDTREKTFREVVEEMTQA